MATESGDMAVLNYLLDNDCPRDEDTCAHAAGWGHLKVLKWARRHRFPWNETTCAIAAHQGNLEILKWAREHGCPWEASEMLECAAECGDVQVVKWVYENGCTTIGNACAVAARNGDASTIAWLDTRGANVVTFEVLKGAVLGEHTNIINWIILTRGTGALPEAVCHQLYYIATLRGSLDIVRCLRHHDLPWDAYKCARIALKCKWNTQRRALASWILRLIPPRERMVCRLQSFLKL